MLAARFMNSVSTPPVEGFAVPLAEERDGAIAGKGDQMPAMAEVGSQRNAPRRHVGQNELSTRYERANRTQYGRPMLKPGILRDALGVRGLQSCDVHHAR